jgi:hypothetical protein
VPTNFPGSLDAFTNPSSGSLLTSPSHSSQHADVNDAVEAVEQFLLDYELDYTQKTTNTSITATSEATANTIVTAGAHTFNGTTIYLIEFFSPYATPGSVINTTLAFYLYDGASSIGAIAAIGAEVTGASAYAPVYAARRLTPSAASHTYSVRARVTSGTGTVVGGAGGSGNDAPCFIRITRAN